jgi:hypothetical protein
MPENGSIKVLRMKLYKLLSSLPWTSEEEESEPKVWFVDGPLAGEDMDLPMMTEVVACPIPALCKGQHVCVTYQVCWFLPQPMAFLVGVEVMA